MGMWPVSSWKVTVDSTSVTDFLFRTGDRGIDMLHSQSIREILTSVFGYPLARNLQLGT